MPRISVVPPLQPKTGATLRVITVSRISKDTQDPKSLEDQQALCEIWTRDRFDGPVCCHVIASQGSGEYLDRDELAELEDLIESRNYDVVICEDLGRICRRVRAYELCEVSLDCDTRVIAINDNLDTAREDWQLNAMFSVLRHEAYNRDTSGRIRRTLRNRFQDGGIVQKPTFGLIKPPGATHDSQLQKAPWAQAVYDQIWGMLENDASFGEVGDWLDAHHVPLPPSARRKKWNGHLVSYVVRNPIVKGVRVRNMKMSKRINKTGRRRSVKAPPDERLERHCPHLAFIDQDRYDRLIAKLAKKNAKHAVGHATGHDPRMGRPKKRTHWPGQHIYCAICGRMLVYSGGQSRGQAGLLLCQGAREYQCWNGVTVNTTTARPKLVTTVLNVIREFPDFDDRVIEAFRASVRLLADRRGDRERTLRSELEGNARASERILAAIRATGHSQTLLEDLGRLEAERAQAELRLAELLAQPAEPQLPDVAGIKGQIEDAFQHLAHDSCEFGRLMRRIISRIVVRPYRQCDCDTVVLRAELTVDLGSQFPEWQNNEATAEHLRRALVVDLFDQPQRVAYRERIAALHQDGLNGSQIAASLGITKTAVNRSLQLHRFMQHHGLTDPYVLLTEPLTNAKFKRHLHPRYRFDPLI